MGFGHVFFYFETYYRDKTSHQRVVLFINQDFRSIYVRIYNI